MKSYQAAVASNFQQQCGPTKFLMLQCSIFREIVIGHLVMESYIP